jgi:hypothetical protein
MSTVSIVITILFWGGIFFMAGKLFWDMWRP